MSKNKSNKKKSNKKSIKKNNKKKNDDLENNLKKEDSITEMDEETEMNISDIEDIDEDEEDLEDDNLDDLIKNTDKEEDDDDEKDDCFYALINSDDDNDDNDDNDEIHSDISDEDYQLDSKKESLIVKDDDRITKRILTKYEYVRLLSDRTVQLSQGAKSMISNTKNLSYKEIADLEIKNKVIPLIIERPLPNGLKERFKISELKLKDTYI